jgi:S1-C subfamily serine protease
MKKYLTLSICCLLSAFTGVLIYDYIAPPKEFIIKEAEPAHVVKVDDILFSGRAKSQFFSSSPTNFIEAADKGRPAVVFIRAIAEGESNGFRRNQFNSSSGSGVILSQDGYIATNNHVVENAKEIEVTLNDNREFRAKLVGADASSDLALLKIEETSLPYLVIGNSDSLDIGEWVLANP